MLIKMWVQQQIRQSQPQEHQVLYENCFVRIQAAQRHTTQTPQRRRERDALQMLKQQEYL